MTQFSETMDRLMRAQNELDVEERRLKWKKWLINVGIGFGFLTIVGIIAFLVSFGLLHLIPVSDLQ